MWWLDICIHCEQITTIKLINTTSFLPFVCMCSKITIASMLYVKCPELITENLYPLLNISPFLPSPKMTPIFYNFCLFVWGITLWGLLWFLWDPTFGAPNIRDVKCIPVQGKLVPLHTNKEWDTLHPCPPRKIFQNGVLWIPRNWCSG